jgi:hypothetical protein
MGFFSLFIKGAMIFVKFNQCCWQQLVLDVLNIYKLHNAINNNGFLE